MQCFYSLYCLFTYYLFFLILQIYLLFIFYFLNNNVTCHFSGKNFPLMWKLYGTSKGPFYWYRFRIRLH
ncbi:unnamed protein product [Brassica oleracea var. botrytis]